MSASMSLAPICLFTYSRISHVKRTVQALLDNRLADSSDLIIFSDGAKSSDDQLAVNEVRAYLCTIKGFKSIEIYRRPYNFGLAASIIDGISKILNTYDKVIVLEDDLVTSKYFLEYMNSALDRFLEDERVISIHGYVYPTKSLLPEAFFLPGADCWGWATWKRGWGIFNADGQHLLDQLKIRKLERDFDFDGSFPFTKMLQDNIKGKNNSWAIRWHASAFLANKLTLHPGRSLVQNIGNDGSGTHCGGTSDFDIYLSSTPIDFNLVGKVESSKAGMDAFKKFYLNTRVSSVRIFFHSIKRFMKRFNFRE